MEVCLRKQEQQLLVLKSIYNQDMRELSNSPCKVSLDCYPYTEDQDDRELYRVSLITQFPKNYPDIAKPFYQIVSHSRYTQSFISKIEGIVDRILKNSIHQQVTYQIMQSVRSWLTAEMLGKEEQALYKQPQIKEVFERPRFSTYTPVTADNFLDWNKGFLEEMRQNKPKEDESKISGKEWFQKHGSQIIEDDEGSQDDLEDVEEQDLE